MIMPLLAGIAIGAVGVLVVGFAAALWATEGLDDQGEDQ